MTDLNIVCIAASHIPCALNRRSAYILCEQDFSIFPICSDAERFLEKVTPSIFRLSTLAISDNSGGTSIWRLRLGSPKMISLDFAQFSDKLFAVAHFRQWGIDFYRAMHVVLSRYCYRKSSVCPSDCPRGFLATARFSCSLMSTPAEKVCKPWHYCTACTIIL